MNQAIKRLWYFNAKSKQSWEKIDEISQLEKLIKNNQRMIEANCNEGQIRLFRKYIDCIQEYSLLIEQQSFCDGFSLGCRITAEAMVGVKPFVNP